MTAISVRRIVRASAVYDLVATSVFAFPVTTRWLFDEVGKLHHASVWPGATPSSADLYAVMFANLMGGLVMVWSLFRIARPTRSAGAADVGARALFAVGMASALVSGASPVVAVMLMLELVWAVAQGVVILHGRGSGGLRTVGPTRLA